MPPNVRMVFYSYYHDIPFHENQFVFSIFCAKNKRKINRNVNREFTLGHYS